MLIAAVRPLLSLVAAAVLAVLAPAAVARCTLTVSDAGSPIRPARGDVAQNATASAARISFVGHASFLIETPQGARIVTDYNGLNGYGRHPDIVTMNNAHSTHYTDDIEPGVKYVLRGWAVDGRDQMEHDITFRDVQVWNVPTNVRDVDGVRRNGNSIFGFRIGDLCIAHLGHLHHRLDRAHLEQLGRIDVLMVPVDGSLTMGVPLMREVVEKIQPQVVLPMHYWGGHQVQRFIDLMGSAYDSKWPDSRTLDVTKAGLPARPTIVVIGGPGGD
jgi:L-ascorbate metabolism protein UlaG (beta-lactamase superfamily)